MNKMDINQDYHPPPIEIQVNGQHRGVDSGTDIPNVMRNEYNMQIFQDPRRRHTSYYFKQLLLEIYQNHRMAVLVVGNAIVVIVLALIFSKVFKTKCASRDDVQAPAGAQIYCNRYVPTDRVVVDIDLNTTAHCYSSKSCVALAESLRKSQERLRYNFIIGGWGFVYVGNGFKCRSEESENALYIRFPVDSIFRGRDFMAARKAVAKFNEIMREGLECSRILHNYTITSTGCGRYDEWCNKVLTEVMTEEVPDRGEVSAQADFQDGTRSAAFFDPFSLDRVYNFRYKLLECTKNLGIKH